MDRLTRLARRAAFWLRARRHAADLAAEIEHHRARTQAALEAGGWSRDEAAAASRRAMGNVTLAREDARAVWEIGALEAAWRDLQYGIRGLRREPAFALTACLTRAVGMAVATTAFSVVDAELWKPLPFPDPDRLVDIYLKAPGLRGGFERIAGADLLDWQAQNRAFTELSEHDDIKRAVLRRDAAESILRMPVTANDFTLLGRPPLVGRSLAAGDERGTRAGMLSERGWHRLFDADPSIVGRTVTIDDQPVAIVGVQNGPLQFTQEPDLFVAGTAAAPLRAAAGAVDPRVPISSVTTFQSRVDNALREERFNLLLVAGFAAAALLLASIGIVGAIAYAVQERRRELGVRLALGARTRAIVFAAVSRAMRAAGVGGLCGLAATLLVARIIGNALYLVPGDHGGLLYNVTTTDPIALGGALLGLMAVATLAAIIPARQAARVDPLVALRTD